MPFYVPFETHFSEGDLIYGLSYYRDNYIINKISGFENAQDYLGKDIWPSPFIDNYLVPPEEKYMRNFINSNQNDPEEKFHRLYKDKLKYIDSHHKYPKYAKDFFKHLGRDNKYRSVIEASEGLDYLNLGRKCKGGLSWVSKGNSKLIRNIHVHFILDGINMKAVADKCEEFHELGSKNKSITGQELRWLFRHRDDSKVSKKVQFWKDGKPVSPPWNGDEGRVWDNYEEMLNKKGKGEEGKYDGLSRLFNILCCGV
ncbi:hypothetical protein [Xenorhabdus sp. IM139775]|uniref:hypothetical protein n=1 Tax=Xenorhabdus sp. IM139775 TaxID=3025876 RepID=UPI002359B4EA|nr:hypothetical protein [Xenorhabdus sp. IM139775]MDC9593312.1 hypothetical protein [Xenorhabdus sp. IM139775]